MLTVLFIFLAVLAFGVIAVGIGAASLGLTDIAQVFISRVLSTSPPTTHLKFADVVVFQLRLPRIVLAIVAGMGFAVSGATMQGVLRNPLVSPYILGMTQAAAFGAGLAIILGIGFVGGGYITIANAFIFALLAVLLVYGIATIRGVTPETVILVGIAVGFLFASLLSLLKYVAPEPQQLGELIVWLMGGLYQASWDNILFMLPAVIFGTILMLRYSWDLNVMSAGEDVAKSLGVNAKRVTVACMVLATLVTASIICFTGIIGFVCLISPHIARMVIGSDHRFLLPASCGIGAILLLCADTVARMLIQPTEIPVGILTSFIGVPFFLYILIKRRRRMWQ